MYNVLMYGSYRVSMLPNDYVTLEGLSGSFNKMKAIYRDVIEKYNMHLFKQPETV